jgi:hypothetical protein
MCVDSAFFGSDTGGVPLVAQTSIAVYSPFSIRNATGAVQPGFLGTVTSDSNVPRLFFADGSGVAGDNVWLGQAVPLYDHTTTPPQKQSPTAVMPGQVIPVQSGAIVQVQIGWQTQAGEALNEYNVKSGDLLNTAYDQNLGWVVPFQGTIAAGFTMVDAAVQALEAGSSGDIISAIFVRSYYARYES